jgi:hypothetical protein
MSLVQNIRDMEAEQHVLKKRSYGMIEVSRGELVRIQLRPWPKLGSIVEARWISHWKNNLRSRDNCRLFYNQPIQHPNFLALTYLESSLSTRLPTIFMALRVLDRIAAIKRSDAILAEISNQRISDRLLRRLGWDRHREESQQRHWIRRFYGSYPVWASDRQNASACSA